jgi:lysine decarboxylase
MNQSEAPYLDALAAYVAREPARLSVPGHKGAGADPELIAAIGPAALLFDVSTLIEGIDVGPEPTPFQRAQALAAEAWGARRSWFLLNGGSGGNHAIAMTIAHLGDRVVVQRNVHSSTIDGLILSGQRPTFVQPEIDPGLGIAHCVTPDALDRALAESPGAVAALVLSPTYFGAVADIAGLAEAAHAHGLPLVVDEAWGSHLYFHQDLPEGALRRGADLVLSSTHKIVGSLTQSAILHLGSGELLDPDLVDRSVTMVESTSPSALLTASLDAARRLAATRGHELLEETLATLSQTRERVRAIPGLDVLDERIGEAHSVVAWDPLRLSIDVRGTGATGHRIAKMMREHDDIHVELFSENVVVAVFGLSEEAAPTAERLLAALEHVVAEIGEVGAEDRGAFAQPPPWGALKLSPRDAFLGPQEVVPFDQAEGRISAESLAAYPPGVPNVLPGELLTAGTLAYIRDSLAHGGMVRGASDRTLQTIRVAAGGAGPQLRHP